MWLLVGLGNPGTEYTRTRHNAGWIAIDYLADEIGALWRQEKKWNADIADGYLEGEKAIFVKPLTYMNRSGDSVALIAQFYKIDPQHIIVLHDDLDFETGVMKIQFDRSAAAHNGIKSMIERLGTQAFHRVRIGIGPKLGDAADFVLHPFSPQELEKIEHNLDNISQGVRSLVAQN